MRRRIIEVIKREWILQKMAGVYFMMLFIILIVVLTGPLQMTAEQKVRMVANDPNGYGDWRLIIFVPIGVSLFIGVLNTIVRLFRPLRG